MMTWDEDIRAVLWLRGGTRLRGGTWIRVGHDLGWDKRRSGRWGWVCICTEPSPGNIWYCRCCPEICRETFSRPISHSGSPLPIPLHTAACILRFPADSPEKLCSPPLPPSPFLILWLLFFSHSSWRVGVTQIPVFPSASHRRVESHHPSLHAFFPWNLPLFSAVCACGLHERSGSRPSTLFSPLYGCILFATSWSTLHASARLNR